MAALSEVVVERVVRCPFSSAHDYAEDFLAEVAARGAEVRVPLRDLLVLRRRVRMVFERRPDAHEVGRPHDAVAVHWSAGTHLFPEFHGTLRLRIASVDETRLTLEGKYRPPLGPFGGVFDALIGRRIARATMADLLRRLGDAMERREAAFRAGPSGTTV
jgi:hypothetical protein